MAKKHTKVTYVARTPHAGSTPFHFFAANASTWRVNTDLLALIADMTSGKEKGLLGFQVFYVPCSIEVKYTIEFYAPQVEGSKYLGFYEPDVKTL